MVFEPRLSRLRLDSFEASLRLKAQPIEPEEPVRKFSLEL
jgi:hypothetical protein